MKIVVIADDMTGAAEVAGAALRFGLSAEVHVGRVYASQADVVVVDADSRSDSSQAAAAKVFELTKQALDFQPDLLFKKLDSMLRGPVAAEIEALQTAGGFERCLLVCGNPRKLRTVVRGRIFIGNVPLHETEFAGDPEHPRRTNDVLELLNLSSAVDLAVGDVACTADLQLHAQAWYPQRRTVLAAGGAEFFEAVLGVYLAENSSSTGFEQLVVSVDDAPLVPDGDVLLLSGSSVTRCDDWPAVPVQHTQSPMEHASEVCRTLVAHGRAAIRAIDCAGGTPAARVALLARAATHVLDSCRPSQVWIEGGRTASTVLRELGHRRLIAVANAGDGIVALRAVESRSALYLLKPGSYPWNLQDCHMVPAVLPEANAGWQWKVSSNLLLKKIWLLWALLSASSVIAHQPDFERVAQIMAEQCHDCHNAETQEGALDLTRFNSLEDVDGDRALWKRLFDVVEAGQMPLPQSGYELNDSQRLQLLTFTREALARPDASLQAIDPGKPILRRLTRLEYNNTLRDLFDLNYDIFMFPERLPVADKSYFTQANREVHSVVSGEKNDKRPVVLTKIRSRDHAGAHIAALGSVVQTSMREYGQKYDVLLPQLGLPGDNRAEYGFANRGDALNFSPLLFEKYLQLAAALASSERLLSDSPVLQDLLGVEPPRPAAVANSSDAVMLSGAFAAREQIGLLAEGNDTAHSSFASELTAAYERGNGGTFDIPAALNNQTIPGKGGLLKLRLQRDVLTINPNVDLWLASFATADETSGDHLLTNRIKGEKVFELTFSGAESYDPQIQHLGVCVLARRNQSGVVQLAAVLSDGQRIVRRAEVSDQSGNVFFSWAAPPGTSIKRLAVDGSEFTGDYILLDDLGFVCAKSVSLLRTERKPSATQADAQRVDLPAAAKRAQKGIEQRLADFLRRAYRREATDQELADALRLVADCTAAGDTEIEALRRLLQSVLSSPEFLFLAEPVTDGSERIRRLGPYELANRLSYFLWSSMPDDELLAMADSGSIYDRDVLRSQVQRMLSDRTHSRELSESFAVQWLRLDQLYSSKPDREIFKDFYSGPQGKSTLHAPMMIEVLLLFETVLAENGSLLQLFDPDFTWLNTQLAELYELKDAFEAARSLAVQSGSIPETLPERSANSYWLRTPLPDRSRGGVMTMAGPLTLTSLPYRTSPIKRGAWLLETVFNRPPSEPKVAFVLEEATKDRVDDSQTHTVRQLFEQHRSDPNCYSCHSRIDPPGFSLEVFDAMGALRTHDGAQPVDASGTWNGRDFATPAEFKDAVRVRETELIRGFVEHLLSYALGRQLEHFDMQTVDQIVRQTADHGYRINDVIEGIVLSYPFQHVRNRP